MIILSQNKGTFYNASQIQRVYFEWEYDEVAVIYIDMTGFNESIRIAEYKNKNRGLGVLNLLYNNWGNVDRFEMPEDDTE